MPKNLVSKSSSSTTRSISASEIARNVKTFQTWSSLIGCEQVAFSDLPEPLKTDVLSVFDVRGKLPANLVTETSSQCKRFKKLFPNAHRFLRKAHKERPTLFSKETKSFGSPEDLVNVYLAWSQLDRMKKTKERWSEADFAANVYSPLRTAAGKTSSRRQQYSIQLPRHRPSMEPTNLYSCRIISTRIIVPDVSLFIPPSSLQDLSQSMTSPYKRMNDSDSVKDSCGHDSEGAFRYQATPALRPQPTPMFEFVGAFFEDKKPSCDSLEHAYRQNRMACAAALRHLHSFGIETPVFGLIWADEKVKAHVDWCLQKDEESDVWIYSAAYPGIAVSGETDQEDDQSPSAASRSTASTQSVLEAASEFFEWDLSNPADAISVFIVLRNLDYWITHGFLERVGKGIKACAKAVVDDKKPYKPWRIEENKVRAKASRKVSLSNSENTASPRTSNASSLPGLPLGSSKCSHTQKEPSRKSNRLRSKTQLR